ADSFYNAVKDELDKGVMPVMREQRGQFELIRMPRVTSVGEPDPPHAIILGGIYAVVSRELRDFVTQRVDRHRARERGDYRRIQERTERALKAQRRKVARISAGL